MRSKLALFLIGSCFLVTGCVRSIQPVLKDDQLLEDKSLTGKWVSKEGKEMVEVQPSGDGKIYPISFTDKEGKTTPLLMRVGKVGEMMVAEFHVASATSEETDLYKMHLLPIYSFLFFEHSAEQLHIWSINPDWLKKYVSAHPGELQVTKPGADEPIVTSSTEDLQAFLIRHARDEGAKADESLWVRPGDPATRPAATAP